MPLVVPGGKPLGRDSPRGPCAVGRVGLDVPACILNFLLFSLRQEEREVR